MNKKIDIKSLFAAKQKEMLSVSSYVTSFIHPTDKGEISENNWINWFNSFLPGRYKAAKATIIDSNGNISDQIDIVLYDAQYSYFAFKKGNVKYLPAESVYAIFEVKQDISKGNMIYAGEKAKSVRILERTSVPIPHAGGTFKPKKPHRIISGILTTKSTWNPPFGVPFKKCLNGFSKEQQIDLCCVLSYGSSFYDYDNKVLTTSTFEESLVFFSFQLFSLLQKVGTVTAIDLKKYMKELSVNIEKNNSN